MYCPPQPCTAPGAFLREVPRQLSDLEAGLQRALGTVSRRLCAYPGVAGVLYQYTDNAVELRIVAPRPMTAPMRLLARAWSRELESSCPGFRWDLRVCAAPPPESAPFHCLFWRLT